jgi:hypothetical protein
VHARAPPPLRAFERTAGAGVQRAKLAGSVAVKIRSFGCPSFFKL